MSELGAISPARRRGLSDEVADRLREAIYSGVYAPGAPLREVDLSERLGVSRGPVREALQLLEREGLVHSEWHRGTHVTDLSSDDAGELESLRGALESLAVEQVIALATDEELTALLASAQAMTTVTDPHEMVRADIEFHDALFRLTQHRRLVDAWGGIRCQVHLFLLTRIGVSTDGYVTRIPDEHRDLVEALIARDADRAQNLFAEHRRLAVDVVMSRPTT